MNPQTNRIDLHHHVFMPELMEELQRRGIEWTGDTGIPQWNLDLDRQTMERHGVAARVVSCQPHAYWGDSEFAAMWSRRANEFLAGIVQDDVEHFGAFASVPLPDPEAACRELEHVYDQLGLDGVLLLTSQDGRYPGDPLFEEFFSELNKRRAVVFIHPNTDPPGRDSRRLPLPPSLVEFTFDTTRCVASLLYSGTLERYPDIRFILPHAGGTVPFLASRIVLGEKVSPALQARVPKGAMHYLKNLYYETALASWENALASVQQFVPPGHILFGTDFPYVHGGMLDSEVAGLETSKLLDRATLDGIYRDNALKLFPRFGLPS